MHLSKTQADISSAKSTSMQQSASAPEQEAPRARLTRLYSAPGGPLLGWLVDEARRRNQSLTEMATELGVTYGYIVQLRNGHRCCENLSNVVVQAAARYLGVPAIVVKLLAGVINVQDFLYPYETEEEFVERAMRRVLDDPQFRVSVPVDVAELPLEAKKALVMLYAESVPHDVLQARSLPNILQWLQRAAVIHDENEGLALDGVGGAY